MWGKLAIHKGMTERGRHGGETRKEQFGPEGYAEMRDKWGKTRGGLAKNKYF